MAYQGNDHGILARKERLIELLNQALARRASHWQRAQALCRSEPGPL